MFGPLAVLVRLLRLRPFPAQHSPTPSDQTPRSSNELLSKECETPKLSVTGLAGWESHTLRVAGAAVLKRRLDVLLIERL